MSIEQDFSNIGSFFKHFGSAIHSALVKVFGQPAMDAVEQTLKTILADDVRVIFEDAINAADTLTVGTGADKRAAAFAQISKDLAAKGIALGTSAINLGIELIVGLVKAKTPGV